MTVINAGMGDSNTSYPSDLELFTVTVPSPISIARTSVRHGNPSISDILGAIKSITLHEGDDTYTINKAKTYVCLTDEN